MNYIGRYVPFFVSKEVCFSCSNLMMIVRLYSNRHAEIEFVEKEVILLSSKRAVC